MAKIGTFTKILAGVGLAGLGAAALNHFCKKKPEEEIEEETELEVEGEVEDSEEE